MSYIEDISVPYAPSRSGFVQRTGPSTESSPGERELFDHTNLWIPGPAFQDGGNAMTGVYAGSGSVRPARAYPKANFHQTWFSLRRPRRWDDGNVTARIWYTANETDDTLVFYCGLQFSLRSEDDAATSSFSTIFFELPCPDVSRKLLFYRGLESDTTGNGYINISSEYDDISILFQRAGEEVEDTCDQPLDLIGVELLYRPRLVESTGIPPWLMKE